MLLSPQIYAPRRVIAAAAAATPTTFDPAHSDAGLTLSGGNLTLTNTSGASSRLNSRSIRAATSGLHYCEMVCNTYQGNQAIGVCTPSFTGGGLVFTGLGWQSDGNVYVNSVGPTAIESWVSDTDTLCICIDATNGKFYGRKNGGNWNNSGAANPVTNTGGIDVSGLTGSGSGYHAAVEVFDQTVGFTANFGATSYTQTAPSGATNW